MFSTLVHRVKRANKRNKRTVYLLYITIRVFVKLLPHTAPLFRSSITEGDDSCRNVSHKKQQGLVMWPQRTTHQHNAANVWRLGQKSLISQAELQTKWTNEHTPSRGKCRVVCSSSFLPSVSTLCVFIPPFVSLVNTSSRPPRHTRDRSMQCVIVFYDVQVKENYTHQHTMGQKEASDIDVLRWTHLKMATRNKYVYSYFFFHSC